MASVGGGGGGAGKMAVRSGVSAGARPSVRRRAGPGASLADRWRPRGGPGPAPGGDLWPRVPRRCRGGPAVLCCRASRPCPLAPLSRGALSWGGFCGRVANSAMKRNVMEDLCNRGEGWGGGGFFLIQIVFAPRL